MGNCGDVVVMLMREKALSKFKVKWDTFNASRFSARKVVAVARFRQKKGLATPALFSSTNHLYEAHLTLARKRTPEKSQ